MLAVAKKSGKFDEAKLKEVETFMRDPRGWSKAHGGATAGRPSGMIGNGESTVDVIVVGGGNAAYCAALAAHEKGASVIMLEAAPEEESGGNSRFTAGAMRVVYNGVDDIKSAGARSDRAGNRRPPISAPTRRTSSSTTWRA